MSDFLDKGGLKSLWAKVINKINTLIMRSRPIRWPDNWSSFIYQNNSVVLGYVDNLGLDGVENNKQDVEIDSATTEHAGVMSASDKKFLEKLRDFLDLTSKEDRIEASLVCKYFEILANRYIVNLGNPGSKFLIQSNTGDQRFQAEDTECLMRTSANTQVAVQEDKKRVNMVGNTFRFVGKVVKNDSYDNSAADMEVYLQRFSNNFRLVGVNQFYKELGSAYMELYKDEIYLCAGSNQQIDIQNDNYIGIWSYGYSPRTLIELIAYNNYNIGASRNNTGLYIGAEDDDLELYGYNRILANKNITVASDARLKENVDIISDDILKALDKVDYKTFNYIGNDNDEYGVIAQEILKLGIPGIVQEYQYEDRDRKRARESRNREIRNKRKQREQEIAESGVSKIALGDTVEEKAETETYYSVNYMALHTLEILKLKNEIKELRKDIEDLKNNLTLFNT